MSNQLGQDLTNKKKARLEAKKYQLTGEAPNANDYLREAHNIRSEGITLPQLKQYASSGAVNQNAMAKLTAAFEEIENTDPITKPKSAFGVQNNNPFTLSFGESVARQPEEALATKNSQQPTASPEPEELSEVDALRKKMYDFGDVDSEIAAMEYDIKKLSSNAGELKAEELLATEGQWVDDWDLDTFKGTAKQMTLGAAQGGTEFAKKIAKAPLSLHAVQTIKSVPEGDREAFMKAMIDPDSLTKDDMFKLRTSKVQLPPVARPTGSYLSGTSMSQGREVTLLEAAESVSADVTGLDNVDEFFKDTEDALNKRKNTLGEKNVTSQFSVSYQKNMQNFDENKPYTDPENMKAIGGIIADYAGIGFDNPGAMFTKLAEELPEGIATGTGAGAIINFIAEQGRLENSDLKRMMDNGVLFTDEKFKERDAEILLASAINVFSDKVIGDTVMGPARKYAKNKKEATEKGKQAAKENAGKPDSTETETPDEKPKSKGKGALGTAWDATKYAGKATGTVGFEAVSEIIDTNVENDSFGEDFDLARDGENSAIAAGWGAGIGGAAKAAGTASSLVTPTGEASKNMIAAGVQKVEANKIKKEQAKADKAARTTEALAEAEASEDYTDIVRKSTSEVEKSEELDIVEIADTISRQFKDAVKVARKSKAQGDLEEADSKMNELDSIREALTIRLTELEDAVVDGKAPKETFKVHKALETVEATINSLVRDEQRLDKVADRIEKLQSATERDDDFEVNAARVLETDAISPDAIGIDQMEALVKLDKWTPEEKERLIRSLDSKRATEFLGSNKNTINSVTSSSPDQVGSDIDGGRKAGTYGKNDRGTKGIKDYRRSIGAALRKGNMKTAKRQRDLLANFAETHRKKSDAIQVALGAFKRQNASNGFQVEPTAQEQGAINYLRDRHNFEVIPGKTAGLAPMIEQEAQAIETVLKEVDGLLQAPRDAAPKKTATTANTQASTNTAPQPNTATQTQPDIQSDTQADIENQNAMDAAADADASPTPNTENPNPNVEATETVSSDTTEPTTETTQPEAQAETDTQTQTVEAVNERINSAVNKVGRDGGRMLTLYGTIGEGTTEEKADATKELEELSGKSDAHKELYDLIQELESGTVSANPDTNQTEDSTESESEAEPDEEVTAIDEDEVTAAEDVIRESVAAVNQAEQEVQEARKGLNKNEVRAKALTRFGLKGNPELNATDAGNVKSTERVERTAAVNKFNEAKAKLRAAKNDLSIAQGVEDYDSADELLKNSTFNKFFAKGKNKTLARSIPNLITQLKRAPSSVLAYTLEKTTLNGRKKAAIRHYAEFADNFRQVLNNQLGDIDAFTSHKGFDPKYHPWFAMLDENNEFSEASIAALTATAYSWLANDASSTRYVNKSVIAARFGANSDDIGVSALHAELSTDGMPTDIVYRALGSNAMRALGIGLNKETGASEHRSTLQSQLGEIVVTSLADAGLIELKSRSMKSVVDSANEDITKSIYGQLDLNYKETPEEWLTNKNGNNYGTKRFYSQKEKAAVDETLSNAVYSTIIVNHIPSEQLFDDSNLNPVVRDIIETNYDTDYIIEKLFATQEVQREPSLDASDELKDSIKMGRTTKEAPEATREALKHIQSQAMVVNQDNDFIMEIMDEGDSEDRLSEVDQIIGVEDPAQFVNMPKRKSESIKAKNAALRREYKNYRKFSNKLANLKKGKFSGRDIPFFLKGVIWGYGRFGYDQQTINPQTSKVHRGLVKMKSWNRKINLNDEKAMNGFKLALAQGLDKDIDKQTVEASLAEVEEIMAEDSIFTQAADAITNLKSGREDNYADTPEGQADKDLIIEAVKLGGHGTHTLNVLTNYARYREALSNKELNPDGQTEFDSDIWLEIDGITNGVVIGTIIFGNGDADQIKNELASGGIFFDGRRDYGAHTSEIATDDEGNEITNSEGKKVKANPDFYNRQSQDWTKELSKLITEARNSPNTKESQQFKAAMFFFTGKSFSKAEDAEIARNASKEPLMQNVYGAGKKSLSEDLAMSMIDNLDDHVQKIMERDPEKFSNAAKIESIAKLHAMLSPLLTTKNGKYFPLIDFSNVKEPNDLLKQDYDKFALKVLHTNVQKSFSEPMLDAIELRFAEFKYNRDIYIDNGKNQAEVFKQIYEVKLAAKKKELVDAGVLAESDFMPESAKNEVIDSLQQFMPSVANPMNEGGREHDLQGIKTSDEEAKTAKGAIQTAQFTPSKPISITYTKDDGTTVTQERKRLSSTVMGTGVSDNIGSGLGVENIHGHDAGIMGRLYQKKKKILGVHDGIIVSPDDSDPVGQTSNEAFFDQVFNSNPFKYMLDLINDTSDEVAAMATRGEITKSQASNMQNTLKNRKAEMFGKEKREGGSDFKYLEGQAEISESVLKELRETVESVGQYYLPGTQFETEYGKAQRKAREQGNATKPKKSKKIKGKKISKPAKANEASSAQRASEMKEKGLKEDKTQQTQPVGDTNNPFGSNLTELLRKGTNFVDAFEEASKLLNGSKKYHSSLVRKLIEYLPEDFKVNVVSSDSDPALVEKMSGYKAVHLVGTGQVYLRDTSFSSNGMSPEIIAHELLHVVTANIIDVVKDSPELASKEAKDTVKKLESLLSQVKEQINPNSVINTEALSNIKEFVAYGLTDVSFINQLKDPKIKVTGFRNKGLMGAFTAFADALKTLFGRNQQLSNTNALKQLIELSAAAMEAQKNINARRSNGEWNVNAAKVEKLTPVELVSALAKGEKRVDDHTNHLKDVQQNIVNAIAGPNGVLVSEAEQAEGDSFDQYINHIANNTQPFLNKIQSVFNLSHQEAYVAEQLEAAIGSKVLDAGFIKERMLSNWEAARNNVTWEDFLPDISYKNDKNEVAKAKAKYDYLFDASDLNVGERGYSDFAGKVVDNRQSDFLTRFTVAMTTSKEVRDVMEGIIPPEAENKGSLLSRAYAGLLDILGRLEEIFNGNTRVPRNVQTAHDILLKRMAQTTHKNRTKLSMIEEKELLIKGMANDYLAKKISSVLTGKAVDNAIKSNVRVVRTTAGLAYLTGLFMKDSGKSLGSVVTSLSRQIFSAKKESLPGFGTEVKSELLGSANPDMDVVNEQNRLANRDVEQERQLARDITSNVIKDKLGTLNEADAAAVDRGLLRTGSADLMAAGYTINQIESYLASNEALDSEIAKGLNQLKDLGHYEAYITQSRALAYYMVHGKSTARVLHKNAGAVARMDGFNMGIDSKTVDKSKPIIDKLASLYAIKYSSDGDRSLSSKVIKNNREGVEFMLKQHEFLRQESLKQIFDGEERQMQKGYVPDTLNNLKTLAWAPKDSEKAKDLIRRGYRFVQAVGKDRLLDNSGSLGLYVIEDGGMSRRVSGSVSYTAGVARGTGVFDSYEMAEMPIAYKDREKQLNGMKGTARKVARKEFSEDFDPVAVADSSDYSPMLIPTFDMNGDIKDFRYEMSEQTKKDVLGKHFDPAHSLGVMEGNIVDRGNTRTRNRQFIDAMFEEYENDGDVRGNDYVIVGEDSSDPEVKEYWNLLPYDAKQYARSKFGYGGIPVKRDMLTKHFGFRKLNLTDIFRKDKESLGRFQKVLASGLEGIIRDPSSRHKVVNFLTGFGNVAENLTSLLKDAYVVKNVVTTAVNITSNFLHLISQDVPARHALTGTIKGYREALKYNRLKGDYKAIELDMRLLNEGTPEYKKKMSERNRLQTLMSSNPTHKLMEAGLFQTIVEDIDTTLDPFSYKSKMASRIDKWTKGRKTEPLVKFGRYMMVTQDTNLYRLLNQPIQMSDFAARYAMFEYLTETVKEKMDDKSALNKVSEHFVNYDMPTSPHLQWLNDHGLFMFTKYYMRMLKPIVQSFAEKPASMLISMFMVQNSVLETPAEALWDLDIMSKWTNPFFNATDIITEPFPSAVLGEALN